MMTVKFLLEDFTAQISFFRGLKRNYDTTNENCSTSCRGCSAIPSTEIYDSGCKGRGKCCDTYDGDLDNVSIQRRNLVQYLLLLPTPVLLNLHAKMVDATILPLLVVDVVE